MASTTDVPPPFERPPIIIPPRLPSYRASATTSLTLSTVVPRSASSNRLSDMTWSDSPALASDQTTRANQAASYRAWRKDSADRLVSIKKASVANPAGKSIKGKGIDGKSSKTLAFVVGAPSSGSGDEGDAENGTTGRSDADSDDDDGPNMANCDGKELGVEDIIRWQMKREIIRSGGETNLTNPLALEQIRQPVYTVDSQDLDSLLPLGISDYCYVLNSRRSQPPTPRSSPPPSPSSPSTKTLPLPPKPNRVSLGKGKFSEVLLVRKGDIEGPEVDIWCLGLTLLRCLTPNKYPLGISHSSLNALSDKVVDALLSIQDEKMRRTLAGLMQMEGDKRMKAFEKYCKVLEEKEKEREMAGAGREKEGKKEFKSTTFLPTERRHSLDLPLVAQRRSVKNGGGHQYTKTPEMVSSITQLPPSRSPSRSRPRHHSILSFDLPHATIDEFPSPRSLPGSSLPSPDLVPDLSPGMTTDSLPTTPRPFSRERATLPAPIELVLLNPTDEPIRRSASYIKYALRCAGILYHVRDSDSDSAFSSFTPVVESSAEDDDSSFVCHLQCVMKLPLDPANHSKASSALIAALRPPILRAQTMGAPVRSSSTPPVGSKAGSTGKAKKEEIKALTFFISIRKAPSASDAFQQYPGSTHFTSSRRSGESASRPPKNPNLPPTSGRRKQQPNTSGDRVIVALSDSRALAVVREALRTELDPAVAVPDEEESGRGRSGRSDPSTPNIEQVKGSTAASGRATSGSRDARNRRAKANEAGLGVTLGGSGAPITTTTTTQVLEAEKRMTGFFDFVGRFPGLGRGNSANVTVEGSPVSASTTPIATGHPAPTMGARTPGTKTPSEVLEDERSKAMAAAYFYFFWSDRAIFKVAASLIPWDKMSDDFVKDRASYSGVVALDPNAIVKNRPAAESALRSHLTVIETQLAQRTLSSNFILDTPTPTYLDLSLSFPLYWVTSFGTAPHLLISFPLISAWLPLLTSHIKTFKNSHPTKGIPQRLSPEDAARIIHATLPDERESKVEEEEPLIREKWLRLGSEVEVTPDDSGKVPQKGTLVALNSEQSVIEVVASGGKCRIHAPRLGFTIRSSRK
ncbi:hypothetical protein P7C70_g219, partial [Phenoliferia sp. Uapishka_3]